ncbi:MAG: cytochrome-c peroxidase [Rhodobacteraceae bacterium]|nr:cytochrome-c peroxidase [Paracoccaceae bacterium]
MKGLNKLLSGCAIAALPAMFGLVAVQARAEARFVLPAPISDADFPEINIEEAALGQLLFYDPILSGNREVACATCHHPAFGTSDGLSLGLGDGGIGLGTARVADPDNLPEARVARNAQALWNVGALEYAAMFHDGRVEADAERPSGMRTPLEEEMLVGLNSMLATQAMFPVVSPDEMAGHYSENEVSQAVRQGILTGPGGAWDLIAQRVRDIGEYEQLFVAVYGHINAADDIGYPDISNAIAAFMAHEFRSDTSPFDAVLRGAARLEGAALEGLSSFYRPNSCSACHSGPFQSDHSFHAMGAVQIGPGKAARFESHARDTGRFRVTGNLADLYAFRTPSLRNVALTGPYGHAGAESDLATFIARHTGRRDAYDRASAVLPALEGVQDWRILDDAAERAAVAAAMDSPRQMQSSQEIANLVAFLQTLTDPVALTGRMGVPETVPSGLAVPNP